VALGCVVLGQIVYLLLYNPLTSETTEMFRFLPASVASFVVPAFVYGIAMARWFPGSKRSSRPTARRRIVDPNI